MTIALSPTDRFTGFRDSDFEVFEIEGLEARMEALIDLVRPKFHALGETIAASLSTLTGEEMFVHVAKHARRTVNPPNDSWVAFANNKRGYKAHPHFQIGLWSTHVFIQFAIIYECPGKENFAERALAELSSLRRAIPDDFVWSKDHMVPTGLRHGDLSDEELADLLHRLKTVKASELTCGIHILRGDPILADGDALLHLAEHTFRTLLPLYRMA
ncbi:DUF1054 domain-containing protein [Cohnella soli]|uniref:UPF0637 protein ACFPOF_10470 n=1 Tax=Cohnella soli TaxID=425005 RepID=A0ABW0HTG1_9BACL